MTITLHTIKPHQKSTRKRKRIGRGNSSGHGTYSGRGLKGQKSRSGVSGLKRLGMRQILLRTPKKRGFKSDQPKNQVVNIDLINKHYRANEVVDPKSLLKKGLINDLRLGIKILGRGKLKDSNIKFQNVIFSQSAKAQIEKPKESGQEAKKD